MKLPVDGTITQGFHPGHQAVDIAGVHRSKVYAPHDGTVSHAGQLGAGSNDAGKAVDIKGSRFVSRLGHNDTIFVSVGQKVKQGQVVALQGFTGYTQPDNVIQGSHVHWVLWDNGVRVDGRKYITAAKPGSNQMFNTIEEVKEAYLFLRGKVGTPAEMQAWIGQSKQRFFQVGKPEADNYRTETMQLRQRIKDIEAALNAERAKPPKTIIKEVEKIIEKPVEVVKEVPLYVHDEETKQDVKAILKLVKSIKGLVLNLFPRRK